MKIAPTLALLLAVAPSVLTLPAFAAPDSAVKQTSSDLRTLATSHARLKLDDKGFVSSLVGSANGKEYVPVGRPSPIISLHEDGTPNDKLLAPVSAAFRPEKGEIALTYANGCTATVKAEAKADYLRFQLVSLTPRDNIDNIVWGPLDTTISGKIGDIIGVVRDPDFAIGMMGVDDNTIAGPVTEGDSYGMGYYVHSPDPERVPLPPQLKEGQWFNIGGGGSDDTAYFSRGEEYFHQIYGPGAKLEPAFGSSIAYHARDRQKSHVHTYSLLPGFPQYRPRKVVSDPLPGVDFIGSTVALYACPDELGLTVLEKIFKDEGMPFITDGDGKWIRHPQSQRPTLWWTGPVDKAIDYAKAMGFKRISRDTGSWYPSLNAKWVGKVPLADGTTRTYEEFGKECHKHGITHGGLHALVLFLQPGTCSDVSPVPSVHLQTVCRTKLAKDLSPQDTEIEVTEPSFLAEKGTWHVGDHANFLRIGGEMLAYDGISESAPWILKGVKRGAHGSKALAHKAGDEVAKLMQNCYNGFVPDMKLVLDYADYYADLMARNAMDDIGLDGYESLVYQHHGSYAMKVFNRRLFERYHKLTGRWPIITVVSNAFTGAWEYIAATNIGQGHHMFDPRTGRRATQGKDIGNGYGASYYPGTFGPQDWNSSWSADDVGNLMAKAIGWDSVFTLKVTQAGIEATTEREAVFAAFKDWQDARASVVFSKELKEKLRDPAYKWHIARSGPTSFVVSQIQETRTGYDAVDNPARHPIKNPGIEQPVSFDFQIDGEADSAELDLPGGVKIKCDRKLEKLQWIICRGDKAWLAAPNRTKIADLSMTRGAVLPKGDSTLGISLHTPQPGKIRFAVTSRVLVNSQHVGR